jgi:serine/threonine protein kinase
MASQIETVSEYVAAVGRSQLMTEAEAAGYRNHWMAEHKGTETDVDSFRRYLQRKQKLTEYQAKLIQRGRSEGFQMAGYTIQDRIGSGQTAGVYLARHNSGQIVALKVLPGSKAKDSQALSRFQREGRLLTQLDHPNVVRAYQLAQSGSAHFIVMEHLEGETLDDILEKRRQLPVGEAVRLVYQALRGLEHLHERKMVHRDLKPANLMIVPPAGKKPENTLASTVKILDIGLGREMFDENEPTTRDVNLTGEGALLGTPDYLAPEQARDARNSDIRADLYSLGCVLYHALAGRPPFNDKNVMTQMVKHATEKPAPVGAFVPGVPAGLEAALARMLEKDPGQRPQTPQAAADALKPFLPEKGGTAEKAAILPAYKQWLESESAFELPAVPPPPAAPKPVPAPPKPAKSQSTPHGKPVAPPPKPAPFVPVALAPDDMVNVELVELPTPSEGEEDVEERSLLDLNRRDFTMLGAGALAVLVAIGAGYGLSKLVRKKPEDEEPQTPSAN